MSNQVSEHSMAEAYGVTPAGCPNMLNDLSSNFEYFPWSTLPSHLCPEDTVFHDFEKEPSKRKNIAADHSGLEMQPKENNIGDIVAEKDSKRITEDCKQPKRMRSTEIHNKNERLRRQKVKEKLKALQELIPHCNKENKISILNDAIKYIKTLQYQIQMMSMGAGLSMSRSPLMMPQPGQQGMQIPVVAPFLHASLTPRAGNGIGMGMGMLGMLPSFNFPVRHMGLYNPCLLGPATAGLAAQGGISEAHSIQNLGYFLEPLDSTAYWTKLSN